MDDDNFCFYCQKRFKYRKNLLNHLQKKHLGSWAQVNIAPLQKEK